MLHEVRDLSDDCCLLSIKNGTRNRLGVHKILIQRKKDGLEVYILLFKEFTVFLRR